MVEAVAQLTKGLEVLAGLPGGPECQRRELDLQLALGQALIAARGFAAPETGRAYARACELCRQVGNTAEFFQALYGKHAFHFERAELHVAYEVAQELLQLAEERDDGGAQALGHRLVGSDTLQLGHFAEARTHLEQGLALYDPARDRSSAQIYAVDTRVLCSTRLAHALLALGYADQASVWNEKALAYAQQLAHPGTLALAFWQACVFYKVCRGAGEGREAGGGAHRAGRGAWLPASSGVRRI